MTDGKDDELLRPDQAAGLLQVKEDTLYRWRLKGVGPAYCKIGRRGKNSIRYSKRTLFQYIADCERRSTSQQVEAVA